MGLPSHPVSLDPDQVAELSRSLADARHGINNHLTLLTTALELVRRDPSTAPRLVATIIERPEMIRKEVVRFSQDFDRAFGITRD